MTAQKIADQVGVTKNQVHEVYKRYKMTTKQNPTFELNMLQKQLLYSGILGDGRLKRNGKHNVYYSECHALQEQEYCKWKYKAFGSLTTGMNMYSKNTNNDSSDAIEFCTKTTPTLIKYLDMQKCKDDAIDRINEIGLAIFVLDDGWFSPHSRKGNFVVAGGVLTDPQLEKLCSKYREFGFGDAHITRRLSHDISLPSSANKYIYYIATKLMPESTDIIQKKDCPQDTDFLQYVPTKFQQNHKTMLRKRNRRKKYQRKLAKLKNIGWYPAPVRYVDKDYYEFYTLPRKKPYYERLYISDYSRNYRFHKRLSNHKVRRILDMPSRGSYKKVHDLWWETL